MASSIRVFENGDFFRLSLPSTRKRRFRGPKTQVFENGPSLEFFLKRFFVWTDQKGGF